MNVHALRRVMPARGFVGPWVQDNVAANQAAVALKRAAAANTGAEFVPTRVGSIVGISASFTVAPAGASLTLTVTKNGSPISGCALTVTAGAVLGRSVTFDPPSAFTVAAGDRIGLTVTTPAGWTATTSDLVADVEISSPSL